MSDAITELQRIRRILIVEAVKLGDSHVCEVSVLDEVIAARIAELAAMNKVGAALRELREMRL